VLHHLVLDGVSAGALGAALDVFATAARLSRSAGARTLPPRALAQRIVSIDGRPVRSSAGTMVPVEAAWSVRRLAAGDAVLVAGVGAASEPEISALLARRDARAAIDALAHGAARAGVHVAASCSSTFLLAETGLLDDEEATTTWWLSGSFARRFPRVRLRADRMVVEAQRRWTAGAAFSHADLALALLARTTRPSLAHLVARYLVLDERPSQARYVVSEHLRSDDPAVHAIERAVRASLDRQLGLEALARAAKTSPRTLARRVQAALGTTPLRFAQRLRVAHAAHLLETTDESVERIATRVGYADAAAFRRLFRRETGTSPRERRGAQRELKARR
jgi:transcriptional regulator GlxA family with amidase domain